MNNYDIGIIGAGIAGSFAALKLAKEYKNVKTILFDLGRPPLKRRRQLEGWLGCLPNSDGKLYINDVSKVSELAGIRKTKSAYNYFENILSNIDTLKIIKDKLPSSSVEKKLKKNGYTISLNDHYQIYPKDIHVLSKNISSVIEDNPNITYSFDNEIQSINKQNDMFIITTEEQETYCCKKVILAVGRSGWRWANKIFSNFGIIINNNIARFGVKIELNSNILKDFNKSTCSLLKNNIEIGPFNWYGSVIPEDHLDMAISAFRSNENRWKTDKVSFNMIGNIECLNNGFEQTDRLGKLTFVLSNDRVIKERVNTILTDKSKISIIPEYNWLKDSIKDLSEIIPDISTKAYFHVPTILPLASKINIKNNMETDIEGLFVAGESAGITGIVSAGVTGLIAADMITK